MEDTNTKHHFLEPDYRYDSEYHIIQALDKLISEFHDRMKELNWYDGGWFIEDAEMIYGLGFISMQNYVNKNVRDFCHARDIPEKGLYQTGRVIDGYSNTNIELVNTLANYAKHGHAKIQKGTRDMLLAFNLRPSGDCDIDLDCFIDDSPIYSGFELLTDKGSLMSIFIEIKEWRDKLWKKFE